MKTQIRITKAPPGSAEEHIREAWVGIEMPAEKDSSSGSWDSDKNSGGFIVKGVDAVQALIDAGQQEAAEYWGIPLPPKELRFNINCCEEV